MPSYNVYCCYCRELIETLYDEYEVPSMAYHKSCHDNAVQEAEEELTDQLNFYAKCIEPLEEEEEMTEERNAVIRAVFSEEEFNEYCKERPDRDFGVY